LTVFDVAEIFGVSAYTVRKVIDRLGISHRIATYRYVKASDLPAIKVGLIGFGKIPHDQAEA
jgi:hypothetical protein